MCGIVGIVGDVSDAASTVRSMAAAIAHRGPDGDGFFTAPGVALGMRRLAVIDLAGGDQPKEAAGGSLHAVFNGEIYNYRELRRELVGGGATFDSDSDTEVLVKAFAAWGDDAFRRFHGMFAAAIWDSRTRQLTLARDPFGKKPLYVWRRGAILLFASELKALARAFPPPDIDRQALTEYLHLGYVPSPRSIYAGVRKLRPGHVATYADGHLAEAPFPWARPGTSPPDEPAVEGLRRRLTTAVERRLVADVEVGILLSGGIDSSLVAWAASGLHPGLRTFSVRFEKPEKDESSFARMVAATLGTRHEETVVTAADALALVDELATIYDEPFADSSGIPTTLICRAASQRVKVVLAGDGGDELFSGYPRYAEPPWLRAARPLRRAVPGAVEDLALSRNQLASRVGNVAALVGASRSATYLRRSAVTSRPIVAALTGAGADLSDIEGRVESAFRDDPVRGPQLADLGLYLPDDLLVKVDRASMSTGLEVRAPFLDLDLAAWALALDPTTTGPPGTKALPRALARLHLPAAVADKPKQGFSVPLATWLRGPLRDELLAALAPDELARTGLVRPRPVATLVERLDQGRKGVAGVLWSLFVLQRWHATWRR